VIEIIKKGIIFVVAPNGVFTICRVSHIISTKGDYMKVSAKITPIGIAQKSNAFLIRL